MRKIIGNIIFVAILLISTKAYATGNVGLWTDKTSVNVGEEFKISISLSRSGCSITNGKNYNRHKQSGLCFRTC